MVFTTLRFIIFMAVIFVLYYIIPKKKQWWLLLAASYIFYACASPVYLIFLFITTLITFLGTRAIDSNLREQSDFLQNEGKELSREEKKSYKKQMAKKRKMFITVVTVLLLLMVVVFKYATFIFNNVSGLLGLFGVSTDSVTLNIILPVGLSFYVFQSLGYCIDVYREMARAEHNFFKHALYVSFFPQLLQGPIGDYNKLAPQLFAGHEFSYKQSVYGLQRVAWGFFKKLVIANQIALVIDSVWTTYADYSGIVFWLFILILYAFQLYADFSGYMDIANGCAQMLGITLDENFETPYFSKNIAEFWRKWHITLGTWFRNYVFYSILRTDWCNGIRKKYKKKNPYISNTLPNVIALLIVWLLIGLWHGSDWCYVVYGLFHGSFIILSTAMAPVYNRFYNRFPKLQDNKLFALYQIVRTFMIVVFGYVIFRPADLSVTLSILRQMISGVGFREVYYFAALNMKQFIEILIGLMVLFIVEIYHYLPMEKSLREKIHGFSAWKRWSIYIVLLLLIIFMGAYGTSGLNQFAYFRF